MIDDPSAWVLVRHEDVVDVNVNADGNRREQTKVYVRAVPARLHRVSGVDEQDVASFEHGKIVGCHHLGANGPHCRAFYGPHAAGSERIRIVDVMLDGAAGVGSRPTDHVARCARAKLNNAFGLQKTYKGIERLRVDRLIHAVVQVEPTARLWLARRIELLDERCELTEQSDRRLQTKIDAWCR